MSLFASVGASWSGGSLNMSSIGSSGPLRPLELRTKSSTSSPSISQEIWPRASSSIAVKTFFAPRLEPVLPINGMSGPPSKASSSSSSSLTRSSNAASGVGSVASAALLPIITGASLASEAITVTMTSAVSPLGSMART